MRRDANTVETARIENRQLVGTLGVTYFTLLFTPKRDQESRITNHHDIDQELRGRVKNTIAQRRGSYWTPVTLLDDDLRIALPPQVIPQAPKVAHLTLTHTTSTPDPWLPYTAVVYAVAQSLWTPLPSHLRCRYNPTAREYRLRRGVASGV